MKLVPIDTLRHLQPDDWPEPPKPTVDQVDDNCWRIHWARARLLDRMTSRTYLSADEALEALQQYHQRQLRVHRLDGDVEVDAQVVWQNDEWRSTVDGDALIERHGTREEAFAFADQRIVYRYPGHDCARRHCLDWQPAAQGTSHV